MFPNKLCVQNEITDDINIHTCVDTGPLLQTETEIHRYALDPRKQSLTNSTTVFNPLQKLRKYLTKYLPPLHKHIGNTNVSQHYPIPNFKERFHLFVTS